MLYGYNAKDGVLSNSKRQNILAAVITKNLMSKAEIIKNIQSKIDFNGKKKGNEKAKSKWEEDIRFVSTYGTDNQKKINGKLIR